MALVASSFFQPKNVLIQTFACGFQRICLCHTAPLPDEPRPAATRWVSCKSKWPTMAELFFCCDCLSVNMTRSINTVWSRTHLYKCTSPFNWSEARFAGETGEMMKRATGPFVNPGIAILTRKKPTTRAAHRGTQAPPGQVPSYTGQGKATQTKHRRFLQKVERPVRRNAHMFTLRILSQVFQLVAGLFFFVVLALTSNAASFSADFKLVS